MATKPISGGGKNAKRGEPSTGVPIEVTRDLFGDLPKNDLALDFGEVHPAALHAIVSGVCGFGGYIGFSAPSGGAAVKLRVTIGDGTGERWLRSGTELAAFLIAIKKRLDELTEEPPGNPTVASS